MTAADLSPFFEERFGEVEEYLDLLEQIEKATQSGIPKLAGSGYRITAAQQKILYSSVYLQLYNLVEATVSRCMSAVTEAARASGRWLPHDLNKELHQEWVRAVARTHTDMTPETRLKHALELSDQIIQRSPIGEFKIDFGGGGNWDDETIHKIVRRVGCRLNISGQTMKAVKVSIRDDFGALKLVKDRRNGLAHGSISFVDCADGVAVSELRTVAASVGAYLREVISSVADYITAFSYLKPDSQPQGTS